MFDKFGEFDSYEELNKAAEGQKAEGDIKALKELAKENGIDVEDAEDYFNGEIPELSTPTMAALGKLEVEEKNLKPEGVMNDWINYIRQLTADPAVCMNIRKKGKSLKGCIGVILKWSFDHQQTVDHEIIKAAGVKAGRVTLGIPDSRTVRKLIKEYYS